MSVDLEEVKQILRENALGMAELREAQEKSREEADRRFQEADRQMREVRESQKETDRQLRDLKAQVSGIGDYHQETEEVVKETARQLRDLKAQVSGIGDYHQETEEVVKETARQLQDLKAQVSGIGDYHQETEEVVKETARQLQDLKAQVSGVSDNIGLSAEEYFQTALAKSLNFAGIQFDDITPNLARKRKGKSCEFDILLMNHDAVALIEAKHRIHMTFPEEMVTKKAAEFRFFFPEYRDYKLYLGAAGFSVDKRAVDEARRLGVGLLKQDGDAVKAVDIPLKAY